MKKAELAATAERDIGEGTDWVPEPVRIGATQPDEADESDAEDEAEAA